MQVTAEAYRFAIAAFVFAALVPYTPDDADLRGLRLAYSVGAFGKLGLLFFAAANGMMAIQLVDPRTIVLPLFIVRIVTNLVVLASVVWAARILLGRPRPPAPSA